MATFVYECRVCEGTNTIKLPIGSEPPVKPPCSSCGGETRRNWSGNFNLNKDKQENWE